ncbi:ankyrin repeat domain-containing protein [Novosphingobium sp. HK4-1]|uniref:Ankyrin repeat domain-containing protein n=2 Tax=Novosphingobium mangrovi (ex Huang et al. 2023) TaxID=2976432 RepID=A0ABT2I1K7_9SPHN|nr:ankyrin repeat domain-containing protein [Novosphingobium mangrovi (ex Huang et al. 2023)]MCT2398681.1 ankyrin repeat domain-containing protein [Novosphingobium mangrovi (ex Huang et al. 2023)]
MKRIASGNAISRTILKVAAPVLAAGLLLSSPAHADFSDGYKFLEAVKKKEGEKVEQAIMDSASIVNARDISSGETALHIVTKRRDLTWLNYLVSHGANVNQADDRGRTPLQLAVNLGWREGAEFLVEHHARTDDSNDAGETPLIFAVHRHDLRLMKTLLEAGADPDRADNSGRSARDYAKLEGEDSNLLTTIETYARKDASKSSMPVYGPVP